MYFCGNQTSYGDKFLVKEVGTLPDQKDRGLKLISVPRFRDTGSIVLLDMNSLESFEIRLIGDDPKI